MRVDISLLPALAAAFMLVFARIGAMVMLLPGLGESNIPVRIKLAIALVLTLVILPLHRAAYQIDLQSLTPLLVLMVHEIVIGVVLGATARVTLAALQVAGSVIAQQLGLGFVTAVDPGRLPRIRPRHHGDDGNLPRLFHRRHARADTAEMKPENHGRRKRHSG